MLTLIQKLLDWLRGLGIPDVRPEPDAAMDEIWPAKHFTLAELTASSTASKQGLSNQPHEDAYDNLRITAINMDYVRELLGNLPIRITSGYRSPALNRAVGGSNTSAHTLGWAVDFIPAGVNCRMACERIMQARVKFDQLIWEQHAGGGEHVHISFDPRGRGEVLSWSSARGYVPGLVVLR